MNELLAYYKYLEAIPQNAILRYQTEVNEEQLDLRDEVDSLIQKSIALQELAALPIAEMWSIYFRYNSLDLLEEILGNPEISKQGNFYRADEIFDILSSCAPSYSKFIIGKMSPNSSVFELLMDSVESKERQEFVRLIKENACDTRCVSGILSFLRQLVPDTSIVNELEQIEDSSTGAEYLSHILCSFEDSDVKEALARFIEWIGLADEVVNSDEDEVEYLRELVARAEKASRTLYYQFDFDTLTKREAAVLVSIKSHPEVAEYFKAWDEEYQFLQKGEQLEIAGQETQRIEIQGQQSTVRATSSLSYSNPAFITKEQFTSYRVDVSDANSYFVGSKTFQAEINGTEDSYNKTKALYEFLCENNAIEHNPENFNAFLYRMTAVHENSIKPTDFPQIPFLLEREKLSYFIGRVVMKCNEYKEDKSCGDTKDQKPRYENDIWGKTHRDFFSSAPAYPEVYSIQQASKDGHYNPKTRDSFKNSTNQLVNRLFPDKE